jgi:hypothetical protein
MHSSISVKPLSDIWSDGGLLGNYPIFDPERAVGPSVCLPKTLPMESAAFVVKIKVFIV